MHAGDSAYTQPTDSGVESWYRVVRVQRKPAWCEECFSICSRLHTLQTIYFLNQHHWTWNEQINPQRTFLSPKTSFIRLEMVFATQIPCWKTCTSPYYRWYFMRFWDRQKCSSWSRILYEQNLFLIVRFLWRNINSVPSGSGVIYATFELSKWIRSHNHQLWEGDMYMDYKLQIPCVKTRTRIAKSGQNEACAKTTKNTCLPIVAHRAANAAENDRCKWIKNLTIETIFEVCDCVIVFVGALEVLPAALVLRCASNIRGTVTRKNQI